MIDLGIHSITYNTDHLDIGDVELNPGDDTLWVEVRQIEPVTPWPFSFGLLYFESIDGRTMGTVKAYGHTEGEIYRLGVGRPPLERSGRLRFFSRHYNLQWVRSVEPPAWSLQFRYETGTSSGGGGGNIGIPATIWSPGDTADARSSFAIGADGFARIKLDFQ